MGLLEANALVNNPGLVRYPSEDYWLTWLKTLNDQNLAPPVVSFSPGSFTIPNGHYSIVASPLILTGTQRITLLGTARLMVL